MKTGRVVHARIPSGFIEVVCAVGAVILMLAPAGPAAAVSAPSPSRGPASAACPAVELLGTRGSGQAAASKTSSGLGQPLDTLNADLKKLVAGDGLSYGFQANGYPALPASGLTGIISAFGSTTEPFGDEIGEYQWSVGQGEQDLNTMISSWVARCASTKLVLAGYDQGAEVTGDVYQSLSSKELGHIFAVELFGDPRFNGSDPAGRGDYDPRRDGILGTGAGSTPRPVFAHGDIVQSWCHALDPVCQGLWRYGPTQLTTDFSVANHGNYAAVGDTVNPPADNAPYPARAAEAINGRLSKSAKASSPPQAAITQPSALPQNEPVVLSAGESWDPSGSPLSYAWDLNGSGSYGTSTGSVPRVTRTFTTAGTFTVGVRVTSAAGRSATARVKVTVASPGQYTAVPGAPEKAVSSTAADATSATLTWSAPASGAPAEGYVIYSDGVPVQDVPPGQPLSFTLESSQLSLPVSVTSYSRAGEGGSSGVVVMSDASVVPDTQLNAMWNTYGNEGGHWTGGDATISTALPDGRDAWLFSDTFLGTVNPDGSRPSDTPLVVHNSMVVQQGPPATAALTTLTGGTASAPTSLVGTAAQTGGIYGYQANSEFVVGDQLYAFYMAYASGSDGPLSATPKYVVLAQFSLPSLTLTGTTELPALEPGKLWGMAVVQDAGYVYIYGNGGDGLYVARAPSGSLLGPASDPTQAWQFWTGSAWSADESAAVSVLNGVAGLSVGEVDGQYVLVTFDDEVPFDANIVAYTASAPTGPFGGKQYLYSVPPQPECSGCFSYYPQLHQEFAPPGHLTISYNVDSLNPQDVYNNVDNYRPVFIDVAWPRVQPPASALPAAPSNLTGTSTGSGVRLSWQASSTPGVQYYVYSQDLSKSEQFYSRIDDTPVTSDLVTTLTPGDTYKFAVTAYDSNGESPMSNPVTETFTLSPPPAAPTGLKATAQSDGSVDLSWNPVQGAQWYTLLDKDVTAGGKTFTSFGPGISATSYTAESFDVGHTYEFEVEAENRGGAGPPSAPATATVYETKPTAPTGLTAKANDDGTISLSWKAPAKGCPCWYWVYYQDATAKQAYTRYLDTSPSALLTYLKIGDSYNVKVSATNAGGEGPATGPVSAKAYMPLPGAPTGLQATPNSDGSISLSWTPPAGCAHCWYFVYYRDATKGQAFKNYLDMGPTARLEYLTIGDTYQVKVTATDAAGQGPASPAVSAVPTLPRPGAPQDLQVVANPDGDIGMSWEPPANCAGCYYYVYYRDATKGQGFKSFLDESTAANLEFLNVGDDYEVKVAATNAAGLGPATQPVTIKDYVPPPTAPQHLVATPGDGEISLSWTAPSVGCPCFYFVFYRDATKGQKFTGYLDESTKATITFLTNGDSYDTYVTAVNSNNGPAGPASDTAVATPHVFPPAAPTGLTATAYGNGTIGLSWAAPHNGCPCYYWVYYRDASRGGGYTSYLDTRTTATLTYLNIGDEYQAYVRATNVGGVGPPSGTASARAYLPPPSAPTGLHVSARTDGETVDMSWSPPGSGCPCWYMVYYRDVSAGGTWQSYLDTSTTAELTFLTTGDEYQVYVAATNAGGQGPATPVQTVVPDIPAPVLSGYGSGDGVRLSWGATNPAGAFWIYLNGQRLPYPVIGKDYLYVGDLTVGTPYTMYVTEAGNGGQSPRSNSLTFTIVRVPIPPNATISGWGCTLPNGVGLSCIAASGTSYSNNSGVVSLLGEVDIINLELGWCGTPYFTIDGKFYSTSGTCSPYGLVLVRLTVDTSFPANAKVCFGENTEWWSPAPTGPACLYAKAAS
jgi:fibronectin type 3 domain-containing protein